MIYISLLIDCVAETRNYCASFIWRSLPVHSGSLKRIDNSKQICLAQPLSFDFFSLLLRELTFRIFFLEDKGWGLAPVKSIQDPSKLFIETSKPVLLCFIFMFAALFDFFSAAHAYLSRTHIQALYRTYLISSVALVV